MTSVNVKVHLYADNGFGWSFSDPRLTDEDEQEILQNVDVGCQIEDLLISFDHNQNSIIYLSVAL